VIARCTCCDTVYDLTAWRGLDLVGDLPLEPEIREPGEVEALRLRNCHCGSTLAIERQQEAA
jgi:hypothetical protein